MWCDVLSRRWEKAAKHFLSAGCPPAKTPPQGFGAQGQLWCRCRAVLPSRSLLGTGTLLSWPGLWGPCPSCSALPRPYPDGPSSPSYTVILWFCIQVHTGKPGRCIILYFNTIQCSVWGVFLFTAAGSKTMQHESWEGFHQLLLSSVPAVMEIFLLLLAAAK